MTDPIRWSEAGDSATETEQMLVRSGQAQQMPSEEKRALWSQIAGALPPAGVPTVAQTAAGLGSGSLLALKGLKALCVLAAASGLVIAGYHWLKQSRPAAVEKPALALAASLAPAVTAPVSALEVAPVAPQPEALSASAAATQAPASSHASQLREESLAVMAARQALRSNDAPRALHLLEQAQQRFKKGALAEEREALSIEALARSGQIARASTRAQAFLTSYPRSPHAADVQRFITK